VLTLDKPLWVYANVLYTLEEPVTGAGYYYGKYTAQAFNLSSRMAIVSPAGLKAAGVQATAKPSLLIEAFDAGWEKEWFTYDASKWARSTHKVYDPQWRAPEGAQLAFAVRSAQANKVIVSVDGAAAEVNLVGNDQWLPVVLSLSDFRDAKGNALKDWKGLKTLGLSAKETLKAKVDGVEKKVVLGGEWVGAAPEFKDLRWVETMSQPQAKLDAVEIKKIMVRVADWQIAHPPKNGWDHSPDRWVMGALYAGMFPWSEVAGDDKYLNYLKAQSETNGWKLGPAQNYADDHCVGALYVELYNKEKDPKMIAALKAQFDEIIKKQSAQTQPAGAAWKGPWSWCDALFMAPPVWAGLSAVTGDLKYLDYMDKEWWSTAGHLYDKDEQLYFRDSDFFGKKESNGKKVFWGRGNGWVLAGLARVLQFMPQDYPTRGKYVTQFQEMSAKIASLQQDDGLWRASLLDPQRYPVKETSASGFYCFGLAWGINQGLLDRTTYLPRVVKAWNAMVGCVHADGKLGNVQPIGADPQKVTDDMTEVYGVGAFLLAGTEMLKLEGGGLPAAK
jgi:rhamnogalacturonyl hydrolase YesR